MSGPVHEGGLFASLRRLLATTLEIAQVRLDLLCTEVKLEKRRIFDGLFWGAVALMITSVGLTLLCGFVILLFWDGHRLAAIGVMALLFLMGGVLLLREVRQSLSNPTCMFGASVAELARDRAGLQESVQDERQ